MTILISAIYNASPEYHFEVVDYGPDRCELLLSGVDRYYRIAQELDLVAHLEWPVLHPFFEGIAEELGVECHVESRVLAREGGARLITRYVIRGN